MARCLKPRVCLKDLSVERGDLRLILPKLWLEAEAGSCIIVVLVIIYYTVLNYIHIYIYIELVLVESACSSPACHQSAAYHFAAWAGRSLQRSLGRQLCPGVVATFTVSLDPFSWKDIAAM